MSSTASSTTPKDAVCRRPGHSNDGNEGNEGNEGSDKGITCPGDQATTSPAAVGTLKPVGINKNLGKFDAVKQFPHIPVAAATLPDGKVWPEKCQF